MYKKLYLHLQKSIRHMPTLLNIFGLRFYFYLDEHLPIHVHISNGGQKAKIGIGARGRNHL